MLCQLGPAGIEAFPWLAGRVAQAGRHEAQPERKKKLSFVGVGSSKSGARAELAFVRSLAQGELPVASLSVQDLTRCVALLKTYEDAAIGFVDASVAAIAERLKITGIVTTDRRHFSIIKGAGGRSFTLLP